MIKVWIQDRGEIIGLFRIINLFLIPKSNIHIASSENFKKQGEELLATHHKFKKMHFVQSLHTSLKRCHFVTSYKNILFIANVTDILTSFFVNPRRTSFFYYTNLLSCAEI